MRKIILVFSNGSTHIGHGLNFEIKKEEKDRLERVCRLMSEMRLLEGHVMSIAQYPYLSMVASHFLATTMGAELGKPFVRLGGFFERLRSQSKMPDTLIVGCVSTYPQCHNGEHSFQEEFLRWWNESSLVFGMPAIPKHDRDGDQAMLVIDYDTKTVAWHENVGEETPALQTT